MSDKARNSHIERTVYVSPDVTPGSSLRYGDWEDREDLARRCPACYGSGKVSDRSWRDARCDLCRGSGRVKPLPLTIIELATGSDYSGSLVEVSNMRCLQKAFPWLVELHGGYGTRGLAYLGRREFQNPALIEAIDALTDYPLVDDSDHSELECELAAQAWEDDGRDDFKRALVAHFSDDCDLSDDTFNPAIDALWRDLCDVFRGGEEYLNEQGDSIYFPVYQIFKQIDDPRFASHLDRDTWASRDEGRGTIREQMQKLCEASRSPS